MANVPEIIQVPNLLKNKVSYGPDGVDDAVLERAEQMVADMQGDYLNWVNDDLARIADFYEKAVAASAADRPAAVQAVFGVAHDIKGQGGSFGYPLMTAIGTQLCRFIEGVTTWDNAHLGVIKIHVDALRLVISNKMAGEGGPVGANLVAGLAAVVAKVSAK